MLERVDDWLARIPMWLLVPAAIVAVIVVVGVWTMIL